MSPRRNTSRASWRSRLIPAGALAVVGLAACSADRVAAPSPAASAAPSLAKGPGDAKDAAVRLTPDQLTALAPTFHTTSTDVEAPTSKPLPLSCSASGRWQVSQKIGRSGGSLVFGRSELKVPSGALSGDVQISADISVGRAGVTVNFAPHGLKFAKAAELRADFTGCTVPAGSALNVYYTDDLGRIVQSMPAAQSGAAQMRMLTDHFSGYVVSWGRSYSWSW